MEDGLLELFEGLKSSINNLSLDEFTLQITQKGLNASFEIYSAISSMPDGALIHSHIQDYKNSSINENYPRSLREDKFEKLKAKIDEVIAQIKSGTTNIPKKRIADEVVNLISDPKVKQICVEINNTPDANVLSLGQSIGEALKWALWYRAKQAGTKLKEDGNLGPLLEESISNGYFTGNASKRFLNDFKNNSQKTGHDMIRHSENYIPDIVVINPTLDGLENILREAFSTK